MQKTFSQIPHQRPTLPLLDLIDQPSDLRALDESQLNQVADELREYLLWSCGQSGGHFGAGLGVVELTVALHYLYDTPEDRIIWDVGHQAYPHKILTGRREQMPRIRQRTGPAAFPLRDESEYDTFGVGHSSTSISAGLGMALGAEMSEKDRKVVAVIGDGAMTAGMAFEAMHHAAHTRSNMLVILNDNNMSISPNVGGLAHYFARVWASKLYVSIRQGGKKAVKDMPKAWEFLRRTEESMKGLVMPDTLFEAIGFNYIGPMDGHNIAELSETIATMKELEGPQLLHIITRKGKGFEPAEADPVGYHAINKIEPQVKKPASAPAAKKPTYSAIFGQWLCDMAAADKRLVGITPAMREGSGMVEFSQQYPKRYHDVAIAEQHALTLAAGLACEKQKPVVAIYSTFLQRAYDQLVHDVALQNLDVTFAIDRAGLVGADGPTHAGSFDIGFMRSLPNMLIAAPSDENECRLLLSTAYNYQGPAAVRYPRGTGPGKAISEGLGLVEIGKANIVRTSTQAEPVVVFAFGSMLQASIKAAEALDATLVDMRFVKPLDEDCIRTLARCAKCIISVEEHSVMTGAGSAINEFLNKQNIVKPVLNLGLPDYFVAHGTPEEMLQECGLDADGILNSINERLALLN